MSEVPENLVNLLMDAPVGIIILKGPTHTVEFMNAEALRVSISPSYLGRPYAEVFGNYPEIESTLKIFNSAYMKGRTFSTTESSMTRDWLDNGVVSPRYFNTVVKPTLNSEQKSSGLMIFSIEITEQVQARGALEKEHKWLESVLNSVPTPISFIGVDSGKTIFSNNAAKRMPGIELGNKHLFSRANKGEKVEGEALEWETPSEKLSLLFNAETLPAGYGKPATVVCTYQDVSLLKRTEGQLHEALKVRDQFFAIASHELKTPLTSMRLQIQIAKRGIKPGANTMPSPEKLLEIFDRCDRQIDRLTNLTNTLLDISRIQNGKLTLSPSRVSLSEIIDEVVGQLSEGLAQVRSQTEIHYDKELFGLWDSSRLEQVFENLMSNALKYAPGAKIGIAVKESKGAAVITFEDNGPGIPKMNQTKIFERFERATTSQSITGMGVGLFVVKELILAHGGTISLESDEGLGTKFTINLPLAP